MIQNRVHFHWSMLKGDPGHTVLRCEGLRFKRRPHWAVNEHLVWVVPGGMTGKGGRYICKHCLVAEGKSVQTVE